MSETFFGEKKHWEVPNYEPSADELAEFFRQLEGLRGMTGIAEFLPTVVPYLVHVSGIEFYDPHEVDGRVRMSWRRTGWASRTI